MIQAILILNGNNMTLVIAGFSYDSFDQESIYFATDSVITTPHMGLSRVLLKGFKKVIEVPIRIKLPLFQRNSFYRYYGNHSETICTIAFAGSTLVAQHLINSITNHLSELYPTYTQGCYRLAMGCEKSLHLCGDYDVEGISGDPMFTKEHLNSLLNPQYISEVVEHSISAVLAMVKTYSDISVNFGPYQAEFILGIYCPQDRQYCLYTYEIVEDNESGAIVMKNQIDKKSIAVIGAKKFESEALSIISEENSLFKADEKIFKFLNDTIDSENSQGNITIGKPTALFNFRQGSLNKTCYVHN